MIRTVGLQQVKGDSENTGKWENGLVPGEVVRPQKADFRRQADEADDGKEQAANKNRFASTIIQCLDRLDHLRRCQNCYTKPQVEHGHQSIHRGVEPIS
ncbi:hypothetical protein [Rhizobium sp. MHM7A]|uniref:hypothetical protein n=1 Tax=Rhizobium sp. MHM7A TaxID=2583233 RepID=UPI0011060A82|nr:hypothetical protein [Rhizobium sp. MHM7A]TLX16647.1 hypothetical protein FFR93_04710 [Rhizobium sp. MHM7A]